MYKSIIIFLVHETILSNNENKKYWRCKNISICVNYWMVFIIEIFWPLFSIFCLEIIDQSVKIFDFFKFYIFHKYGNDFFLILFAFDFNKNLFQSLSDMNIFGNIFIFHNLSESFIYLRTLAFNVLNGHKLFGLDNFNIKYFFLK